MKPSAGLMLEFIRTVLLMRWFDLLITVTKNGYYRTASIPPIHPRISLSSLRGVQVGKWPSN